MLTADYELAKRLARNEDDGALLERLHRCDRLLGRFALVGLVSLLLLVSENAVLRRIPADLMSGHPGTRIKLAAIYIPLLGIALFLIADEVLRKRRELVLLARRLKAEALEEKSCRNG